MKVLHVHAGPINSGSGKGVKNLHTALLGIGVESKLLGVLPDHEVSELDGAYSVSKLDRALTALDWRLQKFFFGVCGAQSLGWHSSFCRGYDFHRYKPYHEADIIHLHWVRGASFSSSFWKVLRDEKRPVVWTMRDMWPFTGGCHYSQGCNRFQHECSSCPQINRNDPYSRSVQQQKKKIDMYGSNWQFVAISENQRRMATNSLVLRERSVHKIFNSIDTNLFKPKAVANSNARFSIPRNKLIILTGSIDLAAPVKGMRYVRSVIDALHERTDVHFVVFGSNHELVFSGLQKNVTYTGLIDDEEVLSDLYASADLFLMPSTQEAFGKTTVEAMSSGTPVIAFLGTPAEEMIDDSENGFLIEIGETSRFVDVVRIFLDLDESQRKKMGEQARAQAVTKFSAVSVARQYCDLYLNKKTNDP